MVKKSSWREWPELFQRKFWFQFQCFITFISRSIFWKPSNSQNNPKLMTKSRSISTVEGSGATCTRNFFEFFFQNRWSFYGPVDPKNSKNFKKVKKNAKNALTSHYANGHGDPCDKGVKNQLAASTAHQVHFGTGLAIFQSPQHVWWLWKIVRKPSCFVKFGCGNG